MAFLDELKGWTETDAAALALGRALGVFSAATLLTDARAVLWTNGTAGNTLYGMLERLVWLGVLEVDETGQRYRGAAATLHPLSPVDGVPSLDSGPPPGSRIHVATDAAGGTCWRATGPGSASWRAYATRSPAARWTAGGKRAVLPIWAPPAPTPGSASG
jgi:hypothetical protein